MMQHFSRLLEEEYQLMMNGRLEKVRESLLEERKKQVEALQLANQIELAQRREVLASRKNDLIEKHLLVDAKIESERHRLEVCRSRKRYLKDSEEVTLQNDLTEVERQLDKEVRAAAEELQQFTEVKSR